MNVLLFGADSATHLLAWKLVNSAAVDEVIVAPGNGGTSFFASSAALASTDPGAVASFVLAEAVDLVVADHAAAAAGLPDELRSLPLPVVGPGHTLWSLHADRCAAREWLQQHGLPLPRGRVCATRVEAETFAATLALPLRIAAAERGGLALSCAARAEVGPAVDECFAASPGRIVVEELVSGPRVAVALLSDGETALHLPAARIQLGTPDEDFEQLQGLHAAATPLWHKLESFLEPQVRQPLAEALRAHGSAANGWIGLTCVIGPRGPLVESVRLVPHGADLAATLPRLESDLLPLLTGCARGSLGAAEQPRWRDDALVAVALRWPSDTAAGSLPDTLFDAFAPGTLVFHHATTAPLDNLYQPRHLRQAAARSGWFMPPSAIMHAPLHSRLAALVVGTGPDLATARAGVYANLRRLPTGQLQYVDTIGSREL